MNIQFYRDSINHHGVPATLYYGAYRVLNRISRVEVLNALALTLDTVDKKFLLDPKRAQGRMLEAEAMRKYTKNPENILTDEFIDAASAMGDRCYAFFDGDVLTSYGWYTARRRHLIEIHQDLVLHFDPRYVYMYHGFTRPDCRGQRLHAIGMAAALEQYSKEGSAGLVSYVDSSNFASLKSCYRMGYTQFGRVVVVKIGERFMCHSTPGCRNYDFRIEHEAS